MLKIIFSIFLIVFILKNLRLNFKMDFLFEEEKINKLKKLIENYKNEDQEIPYENPIDLDSIIKNFSVSSQKTSIIAQKIKSLKDENEELKDKCSKQQQELDLNNQRLQALINNHKIEKEEYESTIERNLSMIEELLKDKKDLNDSLEKIIKEKKELEIKKKEVVNFYKEKLKNELKTQKENLENLEKQKRKQWFQILF